MNRLVIGAAVAVLAVLLVVGAVTADVASVFGGAVPVCLGALTTPRASNAGLSAEQTRNAGVIVRRAPRCGYPSGDG